MNQTSDQSPANFKIVQEFSQLLNNQVATPLRSIQDEINQLKVALKVLERDVTQLAQSQAANEATRDRLSQIENTARDLSRRVDAVERAKEVVEQHMANIGRRVDENSRYRETQQKAEERRENFVDATKSQMLGGLGQQAAVVAIGLLILGTSVTLVITLYAKSQQLQRAIDSMGGSQPTQLAPAEP